MQARPLVPGERMTDVFDRASTLNFTTIASVRGRLSKESLRAALRKLEQRHPLLRARIARDGDAWSFVPGEAAPIELTCVEGAPELVAGLGEASLQHRVWDDRGPRAELTWVRHSADHSSLLLSLHHVVSDGSSGILAMRDLLGFVDQTDDVPVQELPSPGQDHFFPALHAELKASALRALAERPRTPPSVPFRLRSAAASAFEERRAAVTRFRLSLPESQRLFTAAKRNNATVHGVVCAAVSLAIAQESPTPALQQVSHPVNLRRYLSESFPGGPAIGDAVGYYVSSVTTDHTLDAQRDLAELAREINVAVNEKKAAHEPLINAPVRGPLLTERAQSMTAEAFRELAEQKVFVGTYALSNLGALERMGVGERIGELELEEVYFVLASSVMGAFGIACVSHRGRLSLQFTYVEPLIARRQAERVAERARQQLVRFADLQGA
jgi:NRPS condensation-like uncharacterized protein